MIRTRIESGLPPYHGIDLVLTTHSHSDHFSPTSISAFLAANPDARWIGPPQAGGVTAAGQRIAIAPSFRTRADTAHAGVSVGVLHLRHFNQFGLNFSTVENYGFLIEIGGQKVLHLGDVEYSEANFAEFGLPAEQIDLVLLPTFNTLLNQTSAEVISSSVAPDHVIAMHLQQSLSASETAQARALYPGATVFTTVLEVLKR